MAKCPYQVSEAEVLKELQRELETRERLYPRWKTEGKITANVATHRIECIKKAIRMLKARQPQQTSIL